MYVNHCGINFTHQNFVIDRPNGSNDYLFVYIKTPAYFRVNEKEVLADKNSVFLFKKGSPQHFRGAETTYINDYIHFNTEGEEDTMFMDKLSIIYNQPLQLFNVRNFMDVQQLIVCEYQKRSSHHVESINALLKYFLIKLAESMELYRNPSKIKLQSIDELEKLRTAIYENPNREWTVTLMAKTVNLSSSHLQKTYKNLFHTACITDVICARIERAKNLLIFTDLTSREIADNCGYKNETHFSRQFKQLTNYSPQEYRRAFNVL